MEKQIEIYNVLNGILNTDSNTPNSINSILLLSHIRFIDSTLFEILKEKEIINTELNLSDLKILLINHGSFFSLKEKIRNDLEIIYIENKPKLESEIDLLVIEYFLSKLSDYHLELDNYFALYENLFSLILNLPSLPIPILKKLLLNHIWPLYLNDNIKNLSFLFQYAKTRLDSDPTTKSMDGLLLKAACTLFLSRAVYKKNPRHALILVEESIDNLENNKNTLQDSHKELLALSYSHRGTLLDEQNRYAEAFKDFTKSIKLEREVYSIRELFRISLNAGYFVATEKNLVDYIKGIKDQKENSDYDSWKSISLSDIGRYCQDIGLTKEAIYYGRENFEFLKGKNLEQFYLWNAYRNLGMFIANDLINEKYPKKEVIYEAIIYLQEAINIGNTEEIKNQSRVEYIWLAKCNLMLKEFDKAEKNLYFAFQSLLEDRKINSRVYFDFYLIYSDYLLAIGKIKESQKTLLLAINKAKKELNTHHPVILTFIERLLPENKSDSLNILSKEIKRIINPQIRTTGFDLANMEVKPIIEKINYNHISYIPSFDDINNIEVFDIPFFKKHKLLKIGFSKNIRFFLINNEDAFLLDGSNFSIYRVAETDLNIDSNYRSNLKLYIRFFFDSVEGLHGKFFMFENDEGIPWNLEQNEEELAKNREIINNLKLHDIQFLYEEETGWNFKGYSLFKDSIFSVKIEVKKNGFIRFYDEKLLLENMPFLIDDRTSFISTS